MGLFDKKFCDICGDKIGFLGNRKLEDGNLCKSCAGKLSPFFRDRRRSTVEEIRAQLVYRAENAEKLKTFCPVLTFGTDEKIYIDTEYKRLIVTSAEDWVSDNPDIAIVNNGYIRAISTGSTIIRYQLKAGNRIIDKKIDITVKSQYRIVQKYNIISDTVGYMLSTPILYLLTNVGNSIFFNEIHDQNKIQCGTVCMCMNNSYASSMPIVAMQGDITTKCAINATSDIFFILVDANMRPVKLLNPFYITVNVRPDEDQPMITPGILPQ